MCCYFLVASKRGRGARVKGNFHLKRGEVLKILVGQEGGVNTVSGGAGGGGGSFVVTDDNTALLIGKCSGESFRQSLGKWLLSLGPSFRNKPFFSVVRTYFYAKNYDVKTRAYDFT